MIRLCLVAVEVWFAIGLGLAGFGLWVATNWHIRWTKQQLQAYGTDARQQTEAFVGRELTALGATIADLRTQSTSASPNERLDALAAQLEASAGDAEKLENRFDGLVDDLKGRFDALPSALGAWLSTRGAQEAAVMTAGLRHESEALATELRNVEVAMGPAVQGDVRGQIMKAIAKPVSAKFRKENELMAMLVDAGKLKMAEYLQTDQGGGTSVTYRVTSKSPYGL